MKFATLKPNFLVAFPVFHNIARIGVPLNFATFRPSREFRYTQNEYLAVVLRRFKIVCVEAQRHVEVVRSTRILIKVVL